MLVKRNAGLNRGPVLKTGSLNWVWPHDLSRETQNLWAFLTTTALYSPFLPNFFLLPSSLL